MSSGTQAVPLSKTSPWAGRIMSGLVVAFLLFDASIKVLKLAAVVEATAKIGYPANTVVPIGIVLLACTVLYVVPRTSVLGAILLTGYLGGATASQVRLEDRWFLIPVVVGTLVWGGLFLRDERLRAFIPVRSLE
jgi:hypothetical protein